MRKSVDNVDKTNKPSSFKYLEAKIPWTIRGQSVDKMDKPGRIALIVRRLTLFINAISGPVCGFPVHEILSILSTDCPRAFSL